MRKHFLSNLLVDFSQCLSQNKDPFLKRLGTILTGSKESSSGIDQLPVGSPSPGPPEDSNFDVLYARVNKEESVSNITHGIARESSSEQDMDPFTETGKEKCHIY